MSKALWRLFMAAIGTLAAVAAVPVVVWHALAYRRVGRAGRQMRRLLGVPPKHPERVSRSDKAAQSGHFPQWATELTEDGIDAGQIIHEHRRGI